MLTYLESKNLAWVVDPDNKDFKEMKRLEKAAAGDDKGKQAAVELRWKKAESEVKALLLMSVDEGHQLDIEALSCKEAWKALQPARQANVLLRMVTDLLRERLTDHKSVAKYITKVRTAMTQLFADGEAKGLVTEAFVVLCTLAELQQQDRWREWTANVFLSKKGAILGKHYTMQNLAMDAGEYDQALGVTESRNKGGGAAYFVPESKSGKDGKCYECGKPGHFARDCRSKTRNKRDRHKDKDKEDDSDKEDTDKDKEKRKNKDKDKDKARTRTRQGQRQG